MDIYGKPKLLSFPYCYFFFHSKLSLGRLVQQKKLEAVQRKATSFMEELSRNEKRARAWRENLRRVGSESNIHTAVLQPRLVSYAVLPVIN